MTKKAINGWRRGSARCRGVCVERECGAQSESTYGGGGHEDVGDVACEAGLLVGAHGEGARWVPLRRTERATGGWWVGRDSRETKVNAGGRWLACEVAVPLALGTPHCG